MSKNLTPKQAKLVKAKAEGKTVLESANLAEYLPNATDETRRVEAHKTLQKPHIQEALHMELERQGITLEKIIRPVAEALEAKVRVKSVVSGETIEFDAPDLDMQLKGHDRAMRMITPKAEGSSVNINFNQVTAELKDKYSD